MRTYLVIPLEDDELSAYKWKEIKANSHEEAVKLACFNGDGPFVVFSINDKMIFEYEPRHLKRIFPIDIKTKQMKF